MGAFSADDSIEAARFVHQRGRCALCGKVILFGNGDKGDLGAWHAHHVDGDAGNNTLANCACVCVSEPGNCHLLIGHGGDYQRGTLAPRKWFRLEGWNDAELEDVLCCRDPESLGLWHRANG